MKEIAFSFFDCVPVPQEPQITISSDLSDLSGYALIVEAARDFCGWITVTVSTVVRSVVRAFRRILSDAKAVFNRRVFLFEGGLRL